mgnify:CR=1 FL=1
MLVTLPLQEMTLISRVPQRTAAVAQAVGYESQSKFTAAFKEQYGQLPKEYRRP